VEFRHGDKEMSENPNLSFSELIAYTDWERGLWHAWLQQHGESVLAITAGPHGDGRFQTIGDVVRHIFSAEKRYVERLSNRPLTDTASIPSSIEPLFQFGRQSRADFTEFIKTFPAQKWDVPQDFSLMNNHLRATPRKIVVHVLLHEIRHWAQIGTLLRLNGLTGEFHDFLFSPVLGGEFKRESGPQKH
jgi:uncharacterized damage-inducible protein DinB